MQRDQLLRLLAIGTFIVFAEATVAQEEFGDFYTTTNASPVSTNETLRRFSPFPGLGVAEAPPTSPAPTLDFGGPYDSTLSAPPDTCGAVGESNVVARTESN